MIHHFTESRFEPMMQESVRYKPPGKCFTLNRWGVEMTSEELLKRLQEYHGIIVDKKTPYNYAKYRWIQAPKVVNKGRGGGKSIDYDNNSSAEFVASYRLKREKKASKDEVAVAREMAVLNHLTEWRGFDDLLQQGTAQKYIELSLEWDRLYKEAKEAEDPKMKIYHCEIKRLYPDYKERIKSLYQAIDTVNNEHDEKMDRFVTAEELQNNPALAAKMSPVEILRQAELMKEESEKYSARYNALADEMDRIFAEIHSLAMKATLSVNEK